MVAKSPFLNLDILTAQIPVDDITVNKWLTLMLWKIAPRISVWGQNAEVTAPSNGYGLLIGASPTGAFATHANEIAISYEGWFFRAPSPGLIVYDEIGDRVMAYNGSSWDEIAYV